MEAYKIQKKCFRSLFILCADMLMNVLKINYTINNIQNENLQSLNYLKGTIIWGPESQEVIACFGWFE
jgi:hypothetical protein